MPRHSPDSDLSLLQIVTTEGSLATLQLAPAAAQAHSAATGESLSLSLSLSQRRDQVLTLGTRLCRSEELAAVITTLRDLRRAKSEVIITMVTWSDTITPAPTPVVSSAIILRLNVSVQCW